ncbi:hypothetical protein FIBSPDRAFT_900176 [Athelia psychrophila]|uniref:NAD(P)-binding protein n=1 Tax=Athelia psychrophila TaxID=1759441 RepID=A0A165YRG4_9AGAM|nr:hypothetical protein FIBSPDRAFT_900176 [Fibularhizoctonia sp. CBS 109695]
MSLVDTCGLQIKQLLLGLHNAGADADINAPAAVVVVAQRIRDLGGKALVFQLDVTQEDKIEEFNNAGVGSKSVLYRELLAEDWRKVMAVSLDGGVLCCKSSLEGHGETVKWRDYQPSMWGLGASSGLTLASAYCASKVAIPVILQSRFHEHAGIFGFQGAVVNLTREMGLQYAKLGITANALCPGFHITGMINDEAQVPWRRHLIVHKKSFVQGRECTRNQTMRVSRHKI